MPISTSRVESDERLLRNVPMRSIPSATVGEWIHTLYGPRMRPRPAVRLSNTVFCSGVSASGARSRRRDMGDPVGWVERSETHHSRHGLMGFAALNPSYELFEQRDRADRRAGAATKFERQADEAELALAEQGLEVAQALHVGDVELETGLVHERVHHALRARPHRVDAEMHDALVGEPLGGGDVDARIVG